MIITEKKLELNNIHFSDEMKKYLYFDIETTGFSPDRTYLYSIGCAYLNGNDLFYKQWFLDDYTEEKLILKNFMDFSNGFSTLVTYNGLTFDIPYVEKKCVSHNLNCCLRSMNNLDIYRVFYKTKKITNLTSYKQKDMETAFGITRIDQNNGGDLITLYNAYMSMKKLNSDGARHETKKLFELLFIHNFEDVQNLVILSGITNIKSYLISDVTVNNTNISNNILTISFQHNSCKMLNDYEISFLKHINLHTDNMSLEYVNDGFRLHLLIIDCELKYFFKDYNNYYYLPNEDIAVHKSVGEYVDKEFRERATRKNCYCKKNSQFIEIPDNISKLEQIIIYRSSYNDKSLFMDINDLSKNPLFYTILVNEYTKQIYKSIFCTKKRSDE